MGVSKKTGSLAYLGVMLALSVALLFFSSFLPGVEMTLYALASFLVGLAIIESGLKGGSLFYVATVLLSLLIVPNKMGLLPYIFVFGIYGIVKLYIEKIRKLPIEILLKLVFFNITMGIGVVFFKELFIGNIQLPQLPTLLIVIGAQIIFLLYDYLYTQAIAFYMRNIKRVL